MERLESMMFVILGIGGNNDNQPYSGSLSSSCALDSLLFHCVLFWPQSFKNDAIASFFTDFFITSGKLLSCHWDFAADVAAFIGDNGVVAVCCGGENAVIFRAFPVAISQKLPSLLEIFFFFFLISTLLN